MDIDLKLIQELDKHQCYRSIIESFKSSHKYTVCGYVRLTSKKVNIELCTSSLRIIIEYYAASHPGIIYILQHPIFRSSYNISMHQSLYNIIMQNAGDMFHIMQALNNNINFMQSLSNNITKSFQWTRKFRNYSSKIQIRSDSKSITSVVARTANDYSSSSSESASSHSPFSCVQTPQFPSKVATNIHQQPVHYIYEDTSSESLSLEDITPQHKESVIPIPSNKKECVKCTFHNHIKAKKCKICKYKFVIYKMQTTKGRNKPKKKKKRNKKKKNKRKPKWWICTNCGIRNKKVTLQCDCGTIKDLEKCEWKCDKCTTTNHVNCGKCQICHKQRQFEYEGDWQCRKQSCYAINGQHTSICVQCHTPKMEKMHIKENNEKKWNKYGNGVQDNDYNNERYNYHNGGYNDRQDDRRNRTNHTDDELWSKHVGKYRKPQAKSDENEYNEYNGYQNQHPPQYFAADRDKYWQQNANYHAYDRQQQDPYANNRCYDPHRNDGNYHHDHYQ